MADPPNASMLDSAPAGGGDGGGDHPWPWKQGTVATSSDQRPDPWLSTKESIQFALKDLIGRPLRISHGPVTHEIVSRRVTIMLDDNSRIQDIWLDPELPSE